MGGGFSKKRAPKGDQNAQDGAGADQNPEVSAASGSAAGGAKVATPSAKAGTPKAAVKIEIASSEPREDQWPILAYRIYL